MGLFTDHLPFLLSTSICCQKFIGDCNGLGRREQRPKKNKEEGRINTKSEMGENNFGKVNYLSF